jgi:arsenate reductase
MKRIMFACNKNSCRSQMAEGFARAMGGNRVTAASAGLAPTQVHPMAIQVMAEVGIDISQHTSKSIETFNPQDFDAVVSLCGCGVFLPTDWLLLEGFQDWQIDDPDGQSVEVFRRVRDEIKDKVSQLVNATKLDQFISVRAPYHGEKDSFSLAFNPKLQDFSTRVSYIASFVSSGKLPPREGFETICSLWESFEINPIDARLNERTTYSTNRGEFVVGDSR